MVGWTTRRGPPDRARVCAPRVIPPCPPADGAPPGLSVGGVRGGSTSAAGGGVRLGGGAPSCRTPSQGPDHRFRGSNGTARTRPCHPIYCCRATTWSGRADKNYLFDWIFFTLRHVCRHVWCVCMARAEFAIRASLADVQYENDMIRF